jgi:hypothetical protein
VEKSVAEGEQPVGALARNGRKGGIDLAAGAGVERM